MRFPDAWGVAGVIYNRATLRPFPGKSLPYVPYGDRRMRFTLAYRSAVELCDVTPVDINTILAAERPPALLPPRALILT